MNNRKNYNSIVFLTVYFGLVLVGATPQVLAQAAMTRQFDIKTEIEFRDDLDNKPDDEQAIDNYSFALQNLYTLAAEFTEKNSEKLAGKNYEFDCVIDVSANSGKTFKFTGGSGMIWGGFIPALENLSKAFPHTNDKDKERVRVNLILSGNDFFVKTAFTQNSFAQAEQRHNFYDAVLAKFKLQTAENPPALISQNTSLSFDNNQVFIVTRLPRASIDPLIANKNAR
jgi:hypothetical protein